MRVLGISAYYHDSGAALVEDGRIVAAVQQERLTRVKHDNSFPDRAIRAVLEIAGTSLGEVDHVCFYEKPFVKFERLLETYLAFAPRGYRSFATAMPVWVKDKLFQKSALLKALKAVEDAPGLEERLLFAEHHQSHAASAFYPSPFDEALVLTLDGVGEWATTTVGIGRGDDLEIVREIRFPHSLGLLYSAFTYYTGFRVNSGEYKLMGLAPYGEPVYADLIREKLLDVKEDGSFWLDMDYFDYATGLTMTNRRFDNLFGGPPRAPESPLTQKEMDIAASIQKVTEDILLTMTRSLAEEYGIPNLCLAGGVALNCVANGKMLRDEAFKNIWIQPAAGDAGGALGAALAAYHQHLKGARAPLEDGARDRMQGAYLGMEFSQDEIERRLKAAGARFSVLADDDLFARAVERLEAGDAVGWFQGRMEFGPRALGGRSILGDPRNPEMQKTLNLRIKYRESFRPFAPSVLREHVSEWFDLEADSPYMLIVADVAKDKLLTPPEGAENLSGLERLNIARSQIPAVTHVDNSARVQTVHADTNPRYHRLISAFFEKTGCPVVVNTSFNVRGEPIVCTPEDAFHCFMGTEMETLVIGNCLLRKEEQDAALAEDYKDRFDLD